MELTYIDNIILTGIIIFSITYPITIRIKDNGDYVSMRKKYKNNPYLNCYYNKKENK